MRWHSVCEPRLDAIKHFILIDFGTAAFQVRRRWRRAHSTPAESKSKLVARRCSSFIYVIAESEPGHPVDNTILIGKHIPDIVRVDGARACQRSDAIAIFNHRTNANAVRATHLMVSFRFLWSLTRVERNSVFSVAEKSVHALELALISSYFEGWNIRTVQH